MADLTVNIAGVEFKNPVITASGTFGFGREYSEFYPLKEIGGLSCKGITLKPRMGNPPPRIAEIPVWDFKRRRPAKSRRGSFIERDLPWLKEQETVVIANIAGNTPEEYAQMAEKLSESSVDMIEMNISCPNVKHGGVQFGTSCQSVGAITREVRAHCKKAADGEAFPQCHRYFRNGCGCRKRWRRRHFHDQHPYRDAHRYPHPAAHHPQQHRRDVRPGPVAHRPADGLAGIAAKNPGGNGRMAKRARRKNGCCIPPL